MGVFDNSVKIGRRVNDPLTDKNLPGSGSLSWGSITTTSGLSQTTGVDACLVHGDKWQQLVGQHTENVSQHHLLTILGNRQEMVAGNHTHTIVGATNATHVGVHNHTNISPRNDTFAHTRTEMHSEQECQQQPTGRSETTASEITNTENEQHIQGIKWEITGEALEVTTSKTELTAFGVDVTAMKAESKSFHMNLAALATDIHGAKIKAAATHIKAIAGNLNAGIAGNADSPFA